MVPKQGKFQKWTSKRYIIIIVIFVLFYFFFNLLYTDIKNRTQDDFINEQILLARTAAQGISSLLATYQSDLTFITKFDPVIDLSDGYEDFLIDYYQMHASTLDAITRVNASGKIIYTYPYVESVIGKDISKQDHMVKMLSTHEPVISDVFMSVQGYNTFALCVPIFKDEIFTGNLTLLIPLNKLGEGFLDNIGSEKNGHSWLISENLIEIYCRIEGHESKSFLENTMNDAHSLELVDKINKNNHGTGYSIHQDLSKLNDKEAKSKFVIFQRIPLGSTYWTILISYDEKEIYKSLSTFRSRSTIFILVLLLAVIIYVFSLVRVSNIMKGEAERKKAEKLLKKSEEKFKTLFISAGDASLYMHNSMIIDCNEKASKLFKCSKEEIIGKSVLDFSPGTQENGKASRGMALKYIRDAFNKNTIQFEWRHCDINGMLIDTEITLSVINKKDNLFIGIIRDVTEKKKALKAYTESNERFISFMENTPLYAYIKDDSLKHIYSNKKIIELFNIREGSEISSGDLFDPETVKKIEEADKEILFGSKNNIELEYRVNINGNYTWIKDHKFKIPIGNNEYAVGGAALDITDFKNYESTLKQKNKELILAKERAEESDSLKSAFLANMSHEIRTPMNGIMGFTSLLKKPDLSGEEEKRYIDIIEKSGERMLETLQNIIDISKIESGQEEILLSDINLNIQLNEIVDFFQAEANMNKLKLSIIQQLADHEVCIKTDKNKFNSILTNLIKNALKYTHEGSIEIGYAKTADDKLKFFVKDSGIGVPEKRQKAIFNRFEQADIKDKNVYEGSGLGLAITKAYVEMLGGSIWVESIEDSGSVFYFTLPYNPESEVIVQNNKPRSNIPSPNRELKILIVEDEEFAATFLSIILEDHAKDILIASNGIEAVEMCKKNPDLDLILMDIKLPKMNGYEATQEIRKFNKDILIIAQTAFAQIGDKEKCLDVGCNDFIPKPIDKEMLIGMIDKYLGR